MSVTSAIALWGEWKFRKARIGRQGDRTNDFVLGFVFDLLIFSIGYPVARLALPRLSFGRVYAEPTSSLENDFNVFGYRHDRSGRIEIEATLAGSLGFVIFLVMFVSFGFFISAFSEHVNLRF